MPFSSLFGKRAAAADASVIDYAELQKACALGACAIVDVREAHEYAAGHIPGAINQPLSRFDPARLPRGKPVVLVCQSGARSSTAFRQALAAGARDIRHYPEGTGGWRRRGGEMEK